MRLRKPTADWRRLGAENPYYGVLTLPEYLGPNIEEKRIEQFYQTGRDYVTHALETAREKIGAPMNYERALDFGCGVGRVAVPLAERCRTVIGVDASELMLEKAKQYSQARADLSIDWRVGEAARDLPPGPFDLVHSYIVFQHIPVTTGLQLCESLLQKLENGGIGILHFTYRTVRPRNRALEWWKRNVPYGSNIVNVLRGRRFSEPFMEMNPYPLNEVLAMIQAQGASGVYLEFTDHGGEWGAVLYWRKGAVSGTKAVDGGGP